MGSHPLRILYIGPDDGNCRARFDAVRRLGHDADLLDPFVALPKWRWSGTWSFKTGGLGFEKLVRDFIRRAIEGQRYDIAYVDNGELIGAATVRMLREHADRVINYSPDNPYRGRDGMRWRLFQQAVPEYDVLFMPRLSSVADAEAIGARRALRVFQAADDVFKDADKLPPAVARLPFRSPVSFVGTWMPERGALLARLLDLGVPLRIFGPRWDRAPEYSRIAPHTKVGSLNSSEYNAAVAGADISIALLSKGNHDRHTTRSLEIPTLGSLLCGERTEDHQALYEEGREAVFWADPDECAAQCLKLLADTPKRLEIAAAGRQRALANDHFNETFMQRLFDVALGAAAENRPDLGRMAG